MLHKQNSSSSKMLLADMVLLLGSFMSCSSLFLIISIADVTGMDVKKEETLELIYGNVASFDILIQNVYKLQQAKTEKLLVYVTHLKGVLNAI